MPSKTFERRGCLLHAKKVQITRTRQKNTIAFTAAHDRVKNSSRKQSHDATIVSHRLRKGGRSEATGLGVVTPFRARVTYLR